MKQFTHDIVEPFKRGLRPDEQDKGEYLAECYNMKPRPFGLLGYQSPTDPFAGSVAVNFPFPQVLRGREISLLAGQTSLSSINTGVSPWTTSAISTKDKVSGLNKAITAGGVWHMIDLGASWYLINGACTVYRTGLDRLAGESPITYVDDSVTINAGTEHNGRSVIGGFDPTNIWSHDWENIFQRWLDDAPNNVEFTWNDLSSNWVMWSSLGGGDFPLWLFHPDGYPFDTEAAASRVLDRMKRNEFGFMPLPFPGTVQVLKPLGKNLIVYGTRGICALVPISTSHAPSTYGVVKLSDLGVHDRGSVGGDNRAHVLLDAEGTLRRLTGDLKLERLGYRDYLADLLEESVVLTYDEVEDETYICSESYGFVYGPQGLSEHSDRLTSGVFASGAFVALSAATTDVELRVETETFDINLRAIKTVNEVHFGMSGVSVPQATTKFTNNQNSGFVEIGPKKLTPWGVYTPFVSGVDLRIELTGGTTSLTRLDYMRVNWKLSDKRAVRGPM